MQAACLWPGLSSLQTPVYLPGIVWVSFPAAEVLLYAVWSEGFEWLPA